MILGVCETQPIILSASQQWITSPFHPCEEIAKASLIFAVKLHQCNSHRLLNAFNGIRVNFIPRIAMLISYLKSSLEAVRKIASDYSQEY